MKVPSRIQGMLVPGASQLELFAAALVLLKVGKVESGSRAGWEYFLTTFHVHVESLRKVSERQHCVCFKVKLPS